MTVEPQCPPGTILPVSLESTPFPGDGEGWSAHGGSPGYQVPVASQAIRCQPSLSPGLA